MMRVLSLLIVSIFANCNQQDSVDLRTANESSSAEDIEETSFKLMSPAQLVEQELICEPISGNPKSYQGSGACAGNVHIPMDISSVYPELALHYNSTWKTNRAGFGMNVTISEMSYLNLAGPSNSWLQLGNGEYISLVEKSEGSWRAIDPNESSASIYFSYGVKTLVQTELDGTAYEYKKFGNIFALHSVANRFSEKLSLKVDKSFSPSNDSSSEFISYSDGTKAVITRESGAARIARNANNFALIELDSVKRMTRLLHNRDGIYEVHTFTYFGTSNQVATYRYKYDQEPVQTTNFAYDPLGRLIWQENPDGTAFRITRDVKNRQVDTVRFDGTVVEEKFDTAGRIVSMRHLVLDSPTTPLSEETYTYNANGTLRKIESPRGKSEFTYDSKHPKLLATQKVYLGKSVISRMDITRNDLGLETSIQKTGRNGQIESHVVTTWDESSYPFRIKGVQDTVQNTLTSYSYDKNMTTIEYFKSSIPSVSSQAKYVKLFEQKLDRRNLIQQIDPFAPLDQGQTIVKYDSKDRPLKVDKGGKTAEFAYDSAGKPTLFKSMDGIETKVTYNTKGEVSTSVKVFPTGKKQTEVFSRTFHDDGSLATVLQKIELPNEKEETYKYFFADKSGEGKLQRVYKNGVKAYQAEL